MPRLRWAAVAAVVTAVVIFAPPAFAWTWPVEGPVLRGFTFDRDHPYDAGQHRGIDIGAQAGATVRAPAGGIVSFAGTVPNSGRTVTIQTQDGYAVTLVGLGTHVVTKGADVAEGAVVGTIGPSGEPDVAEPHVHLGIRTASDPQGYLDPLTLLPPRLAPTPPQGVDPPAPAVTPAPPAAVAPQQPAAAARPALPEPSRERVRPTAVNSEPARPARSGEAALSARGAQMKRQRVPRHRSLQRAVRASAAGRGARPLRMTVRARQTGSASLDKADAAVPAAGPAAHPEARIPWDDISPVDRREEDGRPLELWAPAGAAGRGSLRRRTSARAAPGAGETGSYHVSSSPQGGLSRG